MKKQRLLVFFPFLAVALSSCGSIIDFRSEEHRDDYIYAMQYHDGFNILQLTDIHWNATSSTLSSMNYLEKLLDVVDEHVEGKIDLVELTGDQFMLANTYHVETFLSFFEKKASELDFMYTIIWGNHDRQGLYNPNWLSRKFKEAKHCIYIEPEDNLYGRSNFVINLTDNGEKSGTTKWQIANIDSGASFSETAVSPFREYDYIRKEQTEWWLLEHERANNAPTIAYYHIPQQDNLIAWNEAHEEGATMKHKFFKLEDFGDNGMEEYASDFITVGSKNNLRAAFQGHAHNVDWTAEYTPDKDDLASKRVVLGLGVKTGAELYYVHIDTQSEDPAMQEGLASVGITESFDLIGGSLVTIKDDDNFDLEHVYYNERSTEDFVKWVKF